MSPLDRDDTARAYTKAARAILEPFHIAGLEIDEDDDVSFEEHGDVPGAYVHVTLFIPRSKVDYLLTAEELKEKYTLGQHERYPADSWQLDVSLGDTLLGYWDWLFCKLQDEIWEEDS